MPSAYVYASVSGGITALSTYCDDGSPHPYAYCGYTPGDCLDIGSSPMFQGIGFWATPDVAVVYVQNITGTVCAVHSVPPPWNNVVRVWMYTYYPCCAPYCNGCYNLLGSVVYAHVDNPHPDGYVFNPSGMLVGWIPGCCESCCGSPYPYNQPPYCYCCSGDACGGCYRGPHSHVEHCDDAGATLYMYCYESVGAGTAAIIEYPY